MKSSFFGWLTLLVGAYVTLLWWTADAHQPSSPPRKLAMNTRSAAVDVHAEQFSRSAADTPASNVMHNALESAPTQDILIEPNADEESPAIEAPPIETRQPTKSIDQWLSDLRTSPDATLRIDAIQALLLHGRQSSVNENIVRALRDAATDSNARVAQAANSALAEVERETH